MKQANNHLWWVDTLTFPQLNDSTIIATHSWITPIWKYFISTWHSGTVSLCAKSLWICYIHITNTKLLTICIAYYWSILWYEVRHMQLKRNTTIHVHYRPPSQCTWHHVPSPGLPCPPGNTCGSANAEWKPAEEPLREHREDQSVQQASNCTTYYSPTLMIWTLIVQTLQLGPMHITSSMHNMFGASVSLYYMVSVWLEDW